MNGIIKRIGGWFAAVVTTVVLGVTLQTQNVLARLENIGADVGFADRVSMTVYDVFRLGSLYMIFVGMALAVAFLMGGLVHRFAKFGRPIIYIVAGSTAIVVMLFAMKIRFFDVHLIAGARDALGISLQMLAGAIGGLVFARISKIKEKTPTETAEAS